MDRVLTGKKVAILVADGFEQEELEAPKRELEEAGASTTLVSPNDRTVRGWKHTEWGDTFDVELRAENADSHDFDALLLPGGVMNPDKLRESKEAIDLISDFVKEGKPIAAICHGPWTLIDAQAVAGRKMTSYPTLQTDLENAGAQWVDEPVVVDRGIITSRRPSDIPQFAAKMIEVFGEWDQDEEPEAKGQPKEAIH